jgi:hypothetical protein
MAYAELEPFGPDAEAWRAGVIASTIANVNRDSKKRPRPFTAQDFMPAEPLTEAEQAAALQERISAAMMAFGGRPRKPGETKRAKRAKQGG